MKKILPLIILAGAFATTRAQVVQWASSVLEVSSELTPVQYAAHQALGKPNVLPAGGQNPNAWTPNKPNRKEFITLAHSHRVTIRQVARAESHNPTAMYRVLLYEEAGHEDELTVLNLSAVPPKARMLNIFTEPTPY